MSRSVLGADVTTQRQDRRIRLVHLRNRLRTATDTAREVIGTHGRRVFPRTVRNRLREFDLRPRRPYVGPNLTPRRRQRRMQWLTGDESRFSLQRSDRRQRVYRRLGERYSDACVREVDRFGGGDSVMVWSGISHGVKTPLVVIQGTLTAVRYRDQVLCLTSSRLSMLIISRFSMTTQDRMLPGFVTTSSTKIMSKCSIGLHTVQI